MFVILIIMPRYLTLFKPCLSNRDKPRISVLFELQISESIVPCSVLHYYHAHRHTLTINSINPLTANLFN